MSATDELISAPGVMSMFIADSPHLLLMRAVAWLDPNTLLRGPQRIDEYFDYDEENELTVGLHVCRECFPTIYTGALQLQWQNADPRTVKRYVLDGINANLVAPLSYLDELRYGPPIDFCGVALDHLEPDETDHPPWAKLLPIFALFGSTPGSDDGHNVAFAAAKALIVSLDERQEDFYRDLVNLLQWLFACSGNTAVDYTQDEFWENGYDTASWSPADVDLINELNQEAHELVTSALRALEVLDTHPAMFRAFKRNIQASLKAVQRLWKGKSHGHYIAFSDDDATAISRCARWPECP